MSQEHVNTSLQNIDLVYYDEVDSTNDELRRILLAKHEQSEVLNKEQKGDSPLVSCATQDIRVPSPCPPSLKAVVATRQTQGRGRLGRRWASPAGSLYLSLALDATDAVNSLASLSLIMALAIRSCLEELVGETQEASSQNIQVKWPNDIVCPKGKLAGILIETIQPLPKKHCAIVGVGINMQRPSKGASNRAAYVSDISDFFDPANPRPSSALMASRVIERMLTYFNTWKRASYDFGCFVLEYEKHLSLLGHEARVSLEGGELIAEGMVRGINEKGHLILANAEGSLVSVAVGEVTLRA